MDSSNLPISTSSNLNPPNRKRKYENSTIISSKKIYFTGPYLRQNWSLPDSMIYFISTNPKSPNQHQKMIKSCKYFFIKNSAVVLQDLCYSRQKKWLFLFIKNIVEMKDIQVKLWITDIFNFSFCLSQKLNPVSSIIPKIYRCDAKEINIWDEEISFKDFCVLSLNVKKILFRRVTVTHEDGTIVAFEKLVENLPNAEIIDFHQDTALRNITSKTVKELLKIPHFSNIHTLTVEYIPDTFDLVAFYEYIKKNKKTSFCLHFYPSISERFANRLKLIVDEIIETEERNYKCPFLGFIGFEDQKFLKLRRLYWDSTNSNLL